MEHSAKTRRRWRFSRLPERSGRRASFSPGSSTHYRSPFFGELPIFSPFFPVLDVFRNPCTVSPPAPPPFGNRKKAQKSRLFQKETGGFPEFRRNSGKRRKTPLRRPPCLSLRERWPSAARTERVSKGHAERRPSQKTARPSQSPAVTALPKRVLPRWWESSHPLPKGEPRAAALVGVIATTRQWPVPRSIAGWQKKWSVSLPIRSILCFTAPRQSSGGLWGSGAWDAGSRASYTTP